MEYEYERRCVASTLRRLYARHLTTTSGGNVSLRCEGDVFVITPGACDKATTHARHVAVLTTQGHNLTPEIVPSSEMVMHQLVYTSYPQVRAVIHAHPPCVSAFASAQVPIELDLACETYALVDPPVRVSYMRSGSVDLAEAVSNAVAESTCVLLENHGAVTTGASLLQAFVRMELLEEAARLTLMVRQLGGGRHLTRQEKAELDRYIGRTVRDGAADEVA